MRSTIIGAIVFVVVGCSKPVGFEKLVPVEGKVTVEGQPLSMGMVVLQPEKLEGPDQNLPPGGWIGHVHNGSYQVMAAGKPGAPPGRYRIMVIPSDAAQTKKWRIQTKSGTMADNSTGVEIDVTDNPEPGSFDLSLTR